MIYFAVALLLLGVVIVLYGIFIPMGEPDMKFSGVLTRDELKASIATLANEMKNNVSRSSLSSYLIRRTISDTYKKISQKMGKKKCLDFENWIFDNFHKLSEVMLEQKKLTAAYNRLPGYENMPRVYRIASLIVKGTGGAVGISTIKECVEAFNEVLPLRFDEIELLPAAINLALIEYVAIFCARSNVINSKFEAAMSDIKCGKINYSLLGYNSYAYAFVKYADGTLLRSFDEICVRNGLDAYKRADNFLSSCAKYTGAVSSAIKSIYSLSSAFDDRFLLSISPLNNFLERDKRIVYSECTPATKLVYLRRICKKSKSRSEIAYASEIVEKAVSENSDIAGYILPRPLGKFALIAYILIVVGYTISNCVTVFMYLPQFKIAAAIIFLPISLNLVLMFVTSINIRVFSRRYMPRIEKTDAKTLIVFPVLIASETELNEMIDNLLTVSHANSEELFSYGLLIDLPSASSPYFNERELSLIESAKERFASLGNRFNLFIRKRTKVEGEEKFQGWEKKRGAILELNNLILSGDESAFEVVCGDSYKVEYVVTLDSDTLINCAYELVQIMEHPFNANKTVVSLNVKSDPSSIRTPFARVMSDSVGLNNYSNFVADVNYDVFGSGNYTGKGIYRVKEFTQKVGDIFMENRVLSHDFVEGAIAGCGSSGETALDSYPETFSSYLGRNVRWLRGDYQLLPFLFTRIRDGKGRHIRNPISIIGRMHILNNIILGLIPISSAILLILSLFASAPVWLTLVAFALNIFIFFSSLRLVFFEPKRVWIELLRQLFAVVCLPVIAYNYLKAIFITIFRLIVRRDLLDWKVFAHSKGGVSFVPNIVASAAYLSYAVFVSMKWTYIVMAALFAFGILYAFFMSRRVGRKQKLSGKELAMLRQLAADTWIYFEKQLTPENNFLPFDNYQEDGQMGYAKRTSPTDISFMLTALVCARNFGFVTKEDFDFYVDKTLSAIERAEKWKGNLFNWLDIYTLKRISGFVSSVDSGNLLTSLVLLRNVTSGVTRSRVNSLIEKTDLGVFADKDGLLRIGYDFDKKSFELNCYDLLGSESMLSYLVGIALGKLRSTCFNGLSGRCYKYKGVSLASWTGGAFEYMMSGIYFDYHKGGLLYSSAKSVLRANKAYAKKHGMPFWGVSESQYAAVDGLGNYQYKAFGVPEIALSSEKRHSVVSPYASMLFLSLSPKEVTANLNRIYDIGAKGGDGLYEAYDKGVIRTYMAHHQGMILASLCNYLLGGVLIKEMSSPDMRAASLLITMPEVINAPKKRIFEQLPPENHSVCAAENTSPPEIGLMTNGSYSVLIDRFENGYSYYNGKYISRYYNFEGGMKLFLSYGGGRISLHGSAYFGGGKAQFVYADEKCEIKQTASVLPYMDGEVRSVEIKNLTSRDLELSIESYMEISLAPLYDDISHKTFSGMFVSTEYSEGMEAVIATRKGLTVAHYFDVKAVYETNRANFFGRGGGSDFGRVLDPIVSGKATVRLTPYQKTQLKVYTLVSEDMDRLKKQVELTKCAGFFEKIDCASELVGRGFGITEKLRRVMSKLVYDASPNLLSGDLPLVYIESNVISERIKSKIRMLSRLGLWGREVQLAFVYYDSGDFLREKLIEQLGPLLEKNVHLTLIDKVSSPELANLAFNSATNIDEISLTPLEGSGVSGNPYPPVKLPPIKYAFKLGKGGYLSDGSYALELGDLPPRPWSNIIANENFGTLITESGGGYTYYLNSRENKLTEWSNDPVCDGCSEAVILYEAGVSWCCTVKPLNRSATYQTIHGLGFTKFVSGYNGFTSTLTEFISGNTKYYELSLSSIVDIERNVEAFFCVKPVVGDFAFKTKHNLSVELNGSLKIENLFNKSKFYMGSDKKITDYVCHKQAYIDGNGEFFVPHGDKGYEIAPAIRISLSVPPLGSVKAVFYLSADNNVCLDTERLLGEAKSYYGNLSCVEIFSGNKPLDYLTKWLPYQVLCSRFFGRTGFYQAGGAIGFRDQLQDCLTVLYIDPELVRNHLLCCAAHQFEAGDVQHWWHPPRTGVRTKISDDRLFLPYVTAKYISFTGDKGILYERVPYLEDVKLSGKDYYGSPAETVKSGTLYEHCVKAIKVSARLGDNGLVLMGGGDWNDAMDKVGAEGRGTTVWGSMFLYLVVSEFMPYFKDKGQYYELKNRLSEAIERAWDGEWYTRAYCDDGTVLGSSASKECNIDLITQSFALLSGSVNHSRALLALFSAASRLVDTENGIIKLLTPPLQEIKAGYICDYPPGVRENGGQYTHGAIWFIMSLFEAGEADYAYSLLDMINPINHSLTVSAVNKYEVEPYVISGDVYSKPAGKGGWSWYTGAASWCYHVITEYLFGINICGNSISVSPRLPSTMNEASFVVKKNGISVKFVIDNSVRSGEWRFVIGGRGINVTTIALTESLNNKTVVVRRYD